MFLTGKVVTNDQVELRYDVFNPDATRDIVLVHGWSGSRQYFVRNARELATAGFRVISYDLRGHGESQKTSWGFSVHRLAKDLDDVLRYLEVRSACCIGTSMGAAVIWAFFELFGPGRIASVVTVDQAPLQNIAPDWKIGSTGCYDSYSLAKLQSAIMFDFEGFAKENAEFCLNDTSSVDADILEMVASETLKADKSFLCKLMANHTALDWREIIKTMTIPCLNCVGKATRVFAFEGVEKVSSLLTSSTNVETAYFDSGHWLYIEEADRFNRVVVEFAKKHAAR